MRLRYLQALSVFAVLLAWEASVRVLRLSEILLPAPSRIATELLISHEYLLHHLSITAVEALFGFFLGFIAAILLGIPAALSPLAKALLTPHIVITQAIPKAALAPLLVVWLGYELTPKVLVAAVSSFLPLVTAIAQGLTAPHRDLLELFDGFAATHRQILVRLRLPVAIPYITASLQMALLYALLGAITAEFVNADKGLGYALVASQTNLNTPLLFACLLLACLLGLAASTASTLIDDMARSRLRITVPHG